MEGKEMRIGNLVALLAVLAMVVSPLDVAATTLAAKDVNYANLDVALLNQDPDPAQPGDYVEVRWKVEKQGNERAEDVRFTLEAGYPFSFDPSDTPEKGLGDWRGYSNDENFYTLYYKLRVDDDALEGDYPVRLTYTYKGASSGVVEEYVLHVADKNRPEFVIGSLTSSPTKLVADTDEASLAVQLVNIGDGDAEHVTATLQAPEGVSPSYSYSDRGSIGTITSGESGTATFYVDVAEGLKGGAYDAKVAVSYKEADDQDNEYKTVILPLEIPLKNKPAYEIVKQESSPAIIQPGDTVELRLFLKNVGGEDADSVSLRAFKESSQPFDFDEKSDFIGSLKAGETGEAVLKFSVKDGSTTKQYLLDLEIRSIYAGEVVLQEKTIPIVVGDARSSSGATGAAVAGDAGSPKPWGIAVTVVVVLIGLGVYLRMNRKPKKR
jgi:hypothetical protein